MMSAYNRAASCLFFLLTVCSYAFLPYEEGMQAEWEARSRQDIQRYLEIPKEEGIPKLATVIYKLSNTFGEPETQQIRKEAVAALISIPGHAQYFLDELEMWKKAAEGNYLSEYERAKGAIYDLRYVQSPEVVAVLGQVVNDPQGRKPGEPSGEQIFSSIGISCIAASAALSEIGIENPPKEGHRESFRQVDAWKDWWAEVKAGKRTYRFVGSPIEYGPDGPVSAKVEATRDRAQTYVPSVPRSEHASTELTPSPSMGTGAKIVVSLAALLLMLGGWLAFRRRA